MKKFKSGFIAIAGAPNVGKSTLLNKVLGEKISITSKKPQTTRNRVLGILNRPNSQMIFLDTPGVIKATNTLNTKIVLTALNTLEDADLILAMIDLTRDAHKSEELVLSSLKKNPRPVLLALNKADLVKKPFILTVIDKWAKLYPFTSIIPVSAKQGLQIKELINIIEENLPEGPPLFPEDIITDMPERFFAAEIIREKIFRLTGEEIPYSVAVTIDSFKECPEDNIIEIYAAINVEKKSQKGIIIGNNGGKLKQIGKSSRIDIQKMLQRKVFLKLFVKVQKNWSKDTKALRRFGY